MIYSRFRSGEATPPRIIGGRDGITGAFERCRSRGSGLPCKKSSKGSAAFLNTLAAAVRVVGEPGNRCANLLATRYGVKWGKENGDLGENSLGGKDSGPSAQEDNPRPTSMGGNGPGLLELLVDIACNKGVVEC